MSLALSPTHDALTRAPIAEDLRVLDHAARDADVRDMAQGAAAVERLWDACQIPDYRKIAPAAHAELVTTLFGFLMKKGRIPDAWFAAQVDQADRTDGRYRHIIGPDRANPDLDLCGKSSRLAGRPRTLAGNRARSRK